MHIGVFYALGQLVTLGSTQNVPAGFNAYRAAQVMVQKSGQSWEWGTAAQALLELYNPELSVYGDNPFPRGKIPHANPDSLALGYAKQFINTNSQVLVGNSAVGDPASLGVSALLLGQSDKVYLDASDRQTNYILNDAPKYSNGAISHRPDVAELWADNMAMSFPFLAYMAVQRNDVNLMRETVRQCGLHRDILKANNNLNWRHIVGPQSQDLGLWSSGNAWAAWGMTRVLHTLQKWPASSTVLQSQAGQLKGWIKEILDGAMRSGTDNGLLRNYLGDGSYFGEVSGSALLSAVAYRMAVNDPGMFGKSYVDWADTIRNSLKTKQGPDGIFAPAANPYDWHSHTPYTAGSPEGQAFVVLLYTAYRDCVSSYVCQAPPTSTISKPGIGPIDVISGLYAPITYRAMPTSTGTICDPVGSCDADGCKGAFSGVAKYPVCTAGTKKGCRCLVTKDTCGARQSCNANDCDGSFNGLGNVAYPKCTGNFLGCECLPEEDTCGPLQPCDQNGCAGSFNSLGNVDYPRCIANFKGCRCLPSANTCGPRQPCDQNGCTGSFNGLGNVKYAKCTGNFKGCECQSTVNTCGPRGSCTQNGCNGSFNGLGNVKFAKCTGNFQGCDCIAQPDTCGPPGDCSQNGCNGQFSLATGKAYCRGNFEGCECKANPQTCGDPVSCDLNHCDGKFLGSDVLATCTNFFKGCKCEATDATCGSQQSCDNNGCNGGYDDKGVARCQGNFKGCKCTSSKNTCGLPQRCDANGCNGSFDANSSVARCRGKFAGCVCHPVASTCGPKRDCRAGGCEGSYFDHAYRCTKNFFGCPCETDTLTNPRPPRQDPPENPGGTQVVVESGCILINNSPRCNANAGRVSAVYESSYHVNADQGPTSRTLILAKYDQAERYNRVGKPGCLLEAHWPRNYAKVIFRQDGCLYDEGGNIIEGQCCKDIAANTVETINPYRDPRPAASCERTPGLGFVYFELWTKDFVNDGGARLWQEIKGCGLLTGRGFGTNRDLKRDGSNQNIGEYRADYLMHFNLPAVFKFGCVGRAIHSAGGPEGFFC
ncbi:hypothetical protein VHEMI02224 [[Torrubiella] hemipterigena]|uniref:Six-hairpin glycosidase n=1 Tax=[Torrubiella] hemipterigena TaxID=1531966 RepID=A0A0A1T9Y9_9HYPO|nr:hypothetical protein VHEMI02224 [[Torrubiella] hemipterigena]